MSQSPPPPTATDVRCKYCGYDLTASMIGGNCPECGNPVRESFGTGYKPTSGMAIASMVTGIVALPGCMCYGILSFIAGAVAVVLGYLAIRQLEDGVYSEGSKGMAIAGMICGGIAFLLSILAYAAVVVMILIEEFG